MRDLKLLPKAHLHLHLEGGMRPATMADLGNKYGLATPPNADGTFATFLQIYGQACAGLRSAEDLRRLVFEVVEDAAADGAVWVEPSDWITAGMAARAGLHDEEAVLRVLLEALTHAAHIHSIGAGLMVAANRMRPVDEAETLARLAARYAGKGVVSFGLVDDDALGPPEPFTEAFAISRAAGLIAAPHGGEFGGAERVRAAVDCLGAQRVQHGIRAVDDPLLLECLALEEVCLDVCPTSNVQLGVVSSMAEHPLPRLLQAGVPVSLNADDPLVFGSGLLGEYERARTSMGLDDTQLAHIAACSIRSCGAPDELKRTALTRIQEWLDAA
jgi:adenosine deaminase